MYVYMYIQWYTYIKKYVYKYTCIYIYIQIFMCIHNIHLSLSICEYVSIYIYTYLFQWNLSQSVGSMSHTFVAATSQWTNSSEKVEPQICSLPHGQSWIFCTLSSMMTNKRNSPAIRWTLVTLDPSKKTHLGNKATNL